MHIILQPVHSSATWPSFSSLCPTVSEHQHQTWKMPENDHFWTGGVTTLHVTRASLWTTYYTPGQSLLYRMAFTSCRCDRPSQSNRPGTRAPLARFSPFPIFIFPMLNQWSSRARADATPSVVPGPKFEYTGGPLSGNLPSKFRAPGTHRFRVINVFMYDTPTNVRT